VALAERICTLQTNSLNGPRVSGQRDKRAEGHTARVPSAGCPLARAEIDRPSFVEAMAGIRPVSSRWNLTGSGGLCARGCARRCELALAGQWASVLALREHVVHLPVGRAGEVCGLARADDALLIERNG
jgi:hypothetical protein